MISTEERNREYENQIWVSYGVDDSGTLSILNEVSLSTQEESKMQRMCCDEYERATNSNVCFRLFSFFASFARPNMHNSFITLNLKSLNNLY